MPPPFFEGCHRFLHRWPCCLRLNPPSKKLLCTDPSKMQQLHSNLVGGLEHLDYFSHDIGNVIIPTDFHSIIFQRGWLKPPTSNSMSFTRVLFAFDLSFWRQLSFWGCTGPGRSSFFDSPNARTSRHGRWKSWLCLWKRWRRWRPGDGSAMGHPPAGSSYFHPK